MGSPASRHMFNSLVYEKTVDEIKAAMEKKIESLKAKVTDREARITRIRKEFDITDAEMINLLAQAANEMVSNRVVATMSYNLNTTGPDPKIVQAGVVQNLLTEKNLIQQEKDSIEQMSLIVRNLRPVHRFAQDGTEYTQDTFTLREDELDFLGF